MAITPAYECMLILKPSLAKEESDKIIDRYAEVVKTLQGEIQKIDRMGKRKIAFDMKKNPEGYYATINFTAPGTAIAELERQMRISDDILKFQTLRNDPVKPLPVKAAKAASAAD
jgi:small subunit ribosomal protein S6